MTDFTEGHDLAAGQPMPDRPLRVIYLGGLGRSGTTIMERMLGQLPGICAAGEVVHLWRRGIAEGERCGCGELFLGCPFWRKVGDVAFGGWDTVDVARFNELRAGIDRIRFIPMLARRSLPAGKQHLLDEYLSYFHRVYAAIVEVTGCQAIVDSSKHASLAFCLGRSRDFSLHVVHVVRDPRAVAYSWSQQVTRPDIGGRTAHGHTRMWTYSPPTAAALWDIQNVSLQLLARRGTPTLVMRYEDFVRDSAGALARITAFAGLPDHPAAGFLGSDHDGRWAELAAVHTVAGNPVRFATGRIPIRQDDRWRAGMPSAQRHLVSALTLPLAKRYGYPRWPV